MTTSIVKANVTTGGLAAGSYGLMDSGVATQLASGSLVTVISATTYSGSTAYTAGQGAVGSDTLSYINLIGSTGVNPVGDTTGTWELVTAAGVAAPSVLAKPDDSRLTVIAAAGSSQSLGLTGGGAFDILASAASCAITLVGLPTGADIQKVTLRLRQDGTGSRAFTFTNTIKWVGGTAYTATATANAVDIVTLLVFPDGTIDGSFAKAYA
jgi:hypothetical protein